MPPLRSKILKTDNLSSLIIVDPMKPIVGVDLAICDVEFPTTASSRASYKTKEGKSLSEFRWKLYDYLRTVPAGKVTTYGEISKALGSSPRAVGGALRNNPFAPLVPCHRVVSSDRYIGGFKGEWGLPSSLDENSDDKKYIKRSVTKKPLEHNHPVEKLKMLAAEGVEFDSKGYLLGGDKYIWKDM